MTTNSRLVWILQVPKSKLKQMFPVAENDKMQYSKRVFIIGKIYVNFSLQFRKQPDHSSKRPCIDPDEHCWGLIKKTYWFFISWNFCC